VLPQQVGQLLLDGALHLGLGGWVVPQVAPVVALLDPVEGGVDDPGEREPGEVAPAVTRLLVVVVGVGVEPEAMRLVERPEDVAVAGVQGERQLGRLDHLRVVLGHGGERRLVGVGDVGAGLVVPLVGRVVEVLPAPVVLIAGAGFLAGLELRRGPVPGRVVDDPLVRGGRGGAAAGGDADERCGGDGRGDPAREAVLEQVRSPGRGQLSSSSGGSADPHAATPTVPRNARMKVRGSPSAVFGWGDARTPMASQQNAMPTTP
jgi:hypothetical protein